MQPLIYKTTLEMERSPTWLTPGAPVELEALTDGTVAVIARRAARWPVRGEKRVRICTLGTRAAGIARDLLTSGTRIRVRIVALVQPHLTQDGAARVAISVWGDARVAMKGSAGT